MRIKQAYAVIAMCCLLYLSVIGGLVWIAVHFIHKYW